MVVHRAIKCLLMCSTVAATAVLVPTCRGSNQATQNVDFGNLRLANKIDVRAPPNKPVGLVTDRAKIQRAADYIERHRTGWVDVWSGPRAPELMFNFYKGDQFVGGFGISTTYLVTGSLSQTVPADEIAALAKDLGLEWPRRE